MLHSNYSKTPIYRAQFTGSPDLPGLFPFPRNFWYFHKNSEISKFENSKIWNFLLYLPPFICGSRVKACYVWVVKVYDPYSTLSKHATRLSQCYMSTWDAWHQLAWQLVTWPCISMTWLHTHMTRYTLDSSDWLESGNGRRETSDITSPCDPLQ